MSDEYQLRKDIDRLISDVYNLESGALQLTTLEEFNELSELVKDTSSLTILETSLENFEEDLSKYNDELESFSRQLSQYGQELGGFTGQLQGFTTAINNLKNWMYGYNPLDPSITYDDPSSDSIKGMINTLDGLLHEIEAGDGIVLENLGRLKDHLQAFSGTLAEFKEYLRNQGVDVSTLDDSVLSLILEINKNIAVIDEHEQTIGEVDRIIGNPATPTSEATGFYKKFDDGDAIMEGLDGRAEDLEVTINGDPDDPTDTGLKGSTEEMIITVKGDPDDPTDNGLIGETQDIIDTIGEPSVGQQSATGMHLLIDNAQSTADGVSGVATLIKDKIGYESIETPLQTQITAHDGQISGVTGQVGSVKSKIGYDLIDDVDLQTQINGIRSVIQNNNENQAIWVINDLMPSQQDWFILMYDYCVDIDNIHYAYSIQNNKAFIRNRSSWEEYDIEQLIEEVDFICGIAYDVRTVSTVTEYEVWDIMLSCLYDVFYVKDENQWVVSNYDYPYARNSVYALTDWLSGSFSRVNVGDNKSQHRINREIDAILDTLMTWNDLTSDISNTYITNFEVNTGLRLCVLKYYRTGYNFTSASEVTLHTGIIPSAYRPSHTHIGSSYNPKISCAVNSSGNIFVNTIESGSKTLNLTIWWHY